jgi:hypothetical protein
MGRTWGAAANYVRDSAFEAAFNDIVFSDSVSASVGGLIGGKVSSNSSILWNLGEVGFDGERFTAFSATSSLTYGLFANMGLRATGRIDCAPSAGSIEASECERWADRVAPAHQTEKG